MGDDYIKCRNDRGLAEIGIGVTEFKCIGATPPDDHPHTYHTTGDQGFVHCLYCNTKYVFLPHLGRAETDPAGNTFEDEATETVSSPQLREGSAANCVDRISLRDERERFMDATKTVSASDLARLRKSRRGFVTAELSEEKVEAISASRMHPRHQHLDVLLDLK